MPYLKLLRPTHWIKNLLIFVPVFFAQEFLKFYKIYNILLAFLVFCLVASAVYILNDIFDKEKDGLHPQKRFRPIASGKISVKVGILLSFIILLTSLLFSFFYINNIFWFLVFYVVLNIVYSKYLKKVVIFDILIISFFYLIRILVGGVAANVLVSNWLILCIFFISLILVIGKRIGEMNQLNKRDVLSYYSNDFLKQLLSVSAALAIVSYGLYSILGFHLGNHLTLVVYSVFFVVLGVFRYLYLIYFSVQVEYPDKLILQDKIIIGSIISWLLFMFYVIYL